MNKLTALIFTMMLFTCIAEAQTCGQNAIDPTTTVTYQAIASDKGIGENDDGPRAFENLGCSNLTSSTTSLKFWGFLLKFESDSLWNADHPDSMLFRLKIFADPLTIDSPACSLDVIPTMTYTGTRYLGTIMAHNAIISSNDSLELVQFDASLLGMDSTVSLDSYDWLMIQAEIGDSVEGSDNCLFAWVVSAEGDDSSWVYDPDSTESYVLTDDLAWMIYNPDSVGIEDEPGFLPAEVNMLSNYPNPFNTKTTILFSLMNSGDVEIDIYDILGRRIDRLNLGYLADDQVHSINFDAGQLATGIYFYSLLVDGQTKVTERFSVIK